MRNIFSKLCLSVIDRCLDGGQVCFMRKEYRDIVVKSQHQVQQVSKGHYKNCHCKANPSKPVYALKQFSLLIFYLFSFTALLLW